MIHGSAVTGYSKGSGTYVIGRHDYPAEVDGWLREAVRLAAGETVFDLGARKAQFPSRTKRRLIAAKKFRLSARPT